MHHHLGIESWCIKYVYQYAHRLIISQRKQNRFPASIVKYLNCAILINPDVSTFWNIRRHLVERVQLNITQEFQFSALVLSKKAKSSEAFFYRRWLYSFQSVEAIDWAVEISLCERCAERKTGNYHAWNHRQWVLQKAPNLLNYEIVKTERFIRKNLADYSCYHHRHFVLTKLFDQQYFDIHDAENVDELYRFVNSGDVIINNIRDLSRFLLPNVDIDAVNANKLKSFLYSLNLAVHDLRMMREMAEMHGSYEAFKCFKRVVVKFAIEIVRLCNDTDYLKFEMMTKAPEIMRDETSQPEIVERLMQQLEVDQFTRIFF